MVLCILATAPPMMLGAGHIGVVHGTWFATHCTGVIVDSITTMRVTVVPILPPFVGIGRVHVLLLTIIHTTVIHGWLLWETMVVALTATVVLVVVVGECALLLSRGIAATWGLLANIMQSWMIERRFCIAIRLLAWLFIVSCVAAKAAPKFASESLYAAIKASSSMGVIP
jgi:hypothetical protein